MWDRMNRKGILVIPRTYILLLQTQTESEFIETNVIESVWKMIITNSPPYFMSQKLFLKLDIRCHNSI